MGYIDMHCDTLMVGVSRGVKTIQDLGDSQIDFKKLKNSPSKAQMFAAFLPQSEMEEWFGDNLRYQYRYEWEKDAFSGSVLKPYFSQTLKPHESVLVFASDKPLAEKPSNIWNW